MTNPNNMVPPSSPDGSETAPYALNPATFDSVESFYQASASTETPVEARAQLEELEHVWSQLAVAEKANGAWDEHIRPDIARAEETLTELQRKGHRLTGHLEDLQYKLTRLGGAAYDGDLEGIGYYARPVPEDLEEAQRQIRGLQNDDHATAARTISEDAQAVDDFDLQMRQPSRIDERSLEQALGRAHTMAEQGASLGDILAAAQSDLSDQLPVWGQRREAVVALRDGLRRVAQEVEELNINRAVYAWEDVSMAMRQGRINADEIDYVRRAPLAQTQEAVGDVMSRISRTVRELQDIR